MRTLVYFLLLSLLSNTLSAQRTVSGKVTDSTGEPLIGANILIKGTSEGTTTDMDGRYRLVIPQSASELIISYTGFAGREVALSSDDTLNITLRQSAAFLEEVVITGVAVGTPTTKVGFNVAKVNQDRLAETPGVNAAVALQGKVPGVVITSGNGLPGSSPAIRIRGSNNLYGFRSSPLIIVDGIQLQEPSNLSDINSEDIQSIEVIKGAAATSLYGSRAGSGVINIITKRGSDQVGLTNITFRNELGTSSLPARIDISDHHHYLLNPDGSVDYSQVAEDEIADNDYPEIYDHQDLFFDPGTFMTNSLAIASRNRETNYYLSLNNTRQSGIIKQKDGYRRQSVRANIDHRISPALKLTFSNYYMQSTRDDPSRQGPGSPFFQLLFLPPSVDLTEPNEEDGTPYNWDVAQKANSQMPNPLYEISNWDRTEQTERFSGSLGLELRPLPFLTLEGAYTLDRRGTQFEQFIDKGYLANPNLANGGLERASSRRTYQTATGRLTFNRQVSAFRLIAQAAAIYEQDEANTFGLTAFDLRFKGVRSLNNSGNFNSGNPDDPAVNRTLRTSNDFEVKTMNYYLTGTVDWQDKLILDGLVRFDGSSLFGPNNRWNTFYRTSLAYRLSEDLQIPQLQELKIRASYGTAGNRPAFNYRFETLSSDGDKNTLGNEDLRSSLQSEVEVGIDARIWDRLSASLTYARSSTTDLFYEVPLPAAAGGFVSQWQNIDSELEATSFEATLGIDIIRSRKIQFSADLTFDRIRQQVARFDFPDYLPGIYIVRAGLSYGTLYTWKFARSEADLFPHQREGRTFVVNNEGWLVEADKLGTPDEQPILIEEEDGNRNFITGNVTPDFNLGLGLNARWRGLQAYCLLHWKQGGDLYNLTKQWTFRDLIHGEIDQSGRPESEKKPVNYYSAFYQSNAPNTYFIEDGSYLKMRELSLSYTFKTAAWGDLGRTVKGLKISLIGRNLFTITNFTGYDPEVAWIDDQIDATISGFDGYAYPNFRTITGAIEIKF